MNVKKETKMKTTKETKEKHMCYERKAVKKKKTTI